MLSWNFCGKKLIEKRLDFKLGIEGGSFLKTFSDGYRENSA
jgi:hypothetical protein